MLMLNKYGIDKGPLLWATEQGFENIFVDKWLGIIRKEGSKCKKNVKTSKGLTIQSNNCLIQNVMFIVLCQKATGVLWPNSDLVQHHYILKLGDMKEYWKKKDCVQCVTMVFKMNYMLCWGVHSTIL